MTTARKRHDGIMQRGRGYQISVGTYREMFRGTKTDARKRRAEIIDQMAKGTFARDHGLTVETLILEKYIPHRRSLGKLNSARAEHTYRAYVRDHVLPHIGSMRVGKVRAEHVEGIFDAMTRAGKAPATVRQVRAILNGAFRYAVRVKAVALNPVAGVEIPERRQPDLTIPTQRRSGGSWLRSSRSIACRSPSRL